jgi:hypothetical protein
LYALHIFLPLRPSILLVAPFNQVLLLALVSLMSPLPTCAVITSAEFALTFKLVVHPVVPIARLATRITFFLPDHHRQLFISLALHHCVLGKNTSYQTHSDGTLELEECLEGTGQVLLESSMFW